MADRFYCSDSPSIDRILSPRYEIIERSLELNVNRIYFQLYDYNHKLNIIWYFSKSNIDKVGYVFDPFASSWYEDFESREIRSHVIQFLNSR